MSKYVFVCVDENLEKEGISKVFTTTIPWVAPIASIRDVIKENEKRESLIGSDKRLLILQEGIFRLLEDNVNFYELLTDDEVDFTLRTEDILSDF